MRRVFTILAATSLLVTGASSAAHAEESGDPKAAEYADAFDTFDIQAQAQGGKGTLFALGPAEGEQNRLAGAKVELSKPAQSYAIAAAYQRGTAAGYTYGAVLGQSAAGGYGVAPEPPPGEAVGVYPSGLTEYTFQGPVGTAAGQTIDVKAVAKATPIPSAYSDFAFQNINVPEQFQYESGHTSARGEPVAEGVETEAKSVLTGITIGPLKIEQMISWAYGLVPADDKDPVARGGVVMVGATLNGTPVKITSRGIELADQVNGKEQKEQFSVQLRDSLAGASIKDVKLGDTETQMGEDGTSVFVSSGALKIDYNNTDMAAQNPHGFGGAGLEVGGANIKLLATRHVEQTGTDDSPSFTLPFSSPRAVTSEAPSVASEPARCRHWSS